MLIGILILFILIILYVLYLKNKFVTLDNLNKEAWSNVKIYLQKRLDLIPNLVNTVKGYAQHESKTLENVINARNKLVSIDMANIDNISRVVEAENQLSKTLRSLMMLHESYPELKADTSFLNLQNELSNIENEILATRKYYNATSRTLNIFCQKFPNALFYGILKFRTATLFEASIEADNAPKVEF